MPVMTRFGLPLILLALAISVPAKAQSRRAREAASGDDYRSRSDAYYGDLPDHAADYRRGTSRSNERMSRYGSIDSAADDDDQSFSGSYPYLPRTRAQREANEDAAQADAPPPPPSRPSSRYRRHASGAVERNNYAGAPVRRHYYGGVDRYDSPGYLDDAGRASALSNGYSRRGVEQYRGFYGRGVRTNDVYPLERDVNPRRWRGRDLNGAVATDDEDTQGADELEDFVRQELSVRPGANLRVSSTGYYSYRNYLDHGNQVRARVRVPVHKRWAYSRGP
jgi:hypothetical protein